MGIEPFFIPKPPQREAIKKPAADLPREQKVEELAKLLHGRGLTSSMTDARRLAEGMVDGERKVIAKSTPPATPLPTVAAADAPDLQTTKMPQSFVQFIQQAAHTGSQDAEHTNARRQDEQRSPERSSEQQDQAAQQPNTTTRQPQAAVQPRHETVTYGREELKPIASVPHVMPRKQIFFEDAPPLSAARGYKGPDRQNVDFLAQRDQVVMRLHPDDPEMRPRVTASAVEQTSPTANPAAATEPVVSTASEPVVTTVIEETPSGVGITRTTETPQATIVEERVIIEEPDVSPVASAAVQYEPGVTRENEAQPIEEKSDERVPDVSFADITPPDTEPTPAVGERAIRAAYDPTTVRAEPSSPPAQSARLYEQRRPTEEPRTERTEQYSAPQERAEQPMSRAMQSKPTDTAPPSAQPAAPDEPKPRPKQDIPKVDLFEFFKKK
jgi:hypothetical protein